MRKYAEICAAHIPPATDRYKIATDQWVVRKRLVGGKYVVVGRTKLSDLM